MLEFRLRVEYLFEIHLLDILLFFRLFDMFSGLFWSELLKLHEKTNKIMNINNLFMDIIAPIKLAKSAYNIIIDQVYWLSINLINDYSNRFKKKQENKIAKIKVLLFWVKV